MGEELSVDEVRDESGQPEVVARERRVDRFAVTSTRAAGVGGALVVALLVTASVALGATADDQPASATGQRAASSDRSYLTPVGTLLGKGDLPRPSLAGDTGTRGVPTGTTPRPTAPVKDQPADAGSIATYSGGAGTLTPAGLATLAMQAGCSASQAVTASAVAIAESGGSPSAQGDTTLMDATWDWSAGLWQIRGLRVQRNTGQLRDSVANQRPTSNAAAMYTISNGCTDWSPWTTYTRGTYLSFVALSRRAVAYVERYAHSHGGALPTVAAPDPNAPIPVGDGSGAAAGDNSAAGASQRSGAARSSAAPKSSSARPSGSSAAKGGGSGTGGGGASQSAAPSQAQATSAPSSKAPGLHLPTKLPTSPPVKLPTKLPTTLPVKVPTTLPVHVPGLP